MMPPGDTFPGDITVDKLNFGVCTLTNYGTLGLSTLAITAPATEFTMYPGQTLAPVAKGVVGTLALSGVPPFSGFYSKDSILGQALEQKNYLLFGVAVFVALLTTFYMFRMWFMTFTGSPRDEHVYEHAHESPWLMTLPLVTLAFFSVIVAWGWPIWDAEKSAMEHHMLHSQHDAKETTASGRYGDIFRFRRSR